MTSIKTQGITADGTLTISGASTFNTTPTMITASAGNNSTTGATTAYVDGAVATILAGTNTWSGVNTFSSATSTNGLILTGNSNITLGTGAVAPSTLQMGGISSTLPSLVNTTVAITATEIGTFTSIPAGTYLFTWCLQLTPQSTTGLLTLSIGVTVGAVSTGVSQSIPPFASVNTFQLNGAGYYSSTTAFNMSLWAQSTVATSTTSTTGYSFKYMRIA